MSAPFPLRPVRSPRRSLAPALSAVLWMAPLLHGAHTDCQTTARHVSRQVAAHPARVLLIVEDTLVVSDTCACEVVKAAIVAAKASAKLAGQIVLVAIHAAPAKAALIAECAKAASPDAATEVNAAVRQALGPDADLPTASAADRPADPTQSAASPRPAAAVTPPESSDSDFGLSPVAIGGVYLVYPGGAGAPQIVKGDDGKLYFIGPRGKQVPLDPPPPLTRRPTRPPGPIFVRPASPTTSNSLPEVPTSADPAPPAPQSAQSPR